MKGDKFAHFSKFFIGSGGGLLIDGCVTEGQSHVRFIYFVLDRIRFCQSSFKFRVCWKGWCGVLTMKVLKRKVWYFEEGDVLL